MHLQGSVLKHLICTSSVVLCYFAVLYKECAVCKAFKINTTYQYFNGNWMIMNSSANLKYGQWDFTAIKRQTVSFRHSPEQEAVQICTSPRGALRNVMLEGGIVPSSAYRSAKGMCLLCHHVTTAMLPFCQLWLGPVSGNKSVGRLLARSPHIELPHRGWRQSVPQVLTRCQH